MLCLSRRILLVLVATVGTFSSLPLTSNAQSCVGVSVKGGGSKCEKVKSICSPVDLGFGKSGVCETIGPPAEQECDCVGKDKPSPSYSLTASPLMPALVTAGNSATATITIAPSNGFNSDVTLTCAVTGGATPPPTCSFQSGTNPVKGGSGTSTLMVQASNGTPSGIYSIAVTGTDGNGLEPEDGGQSLKWSVQFAIPNADVPILETIYIPPVPGGTGEAATARITSLSFPGVVFVQPADSLEFRLRAPWPSTLQVLINGQLLQEVPAGSPPPQPDDPGYFSVKTSAMPGWPDKINPQTPGYHWFFWLVDVKLPKLFRYLGPSTLVVPPFQVTLRDISVDSSHTPAPDLNLMMEAYPRPPYGPALSTPPSTVFLSGDNAKGHSQSALVAQDVTVAGWLAGGYPYRGNDNQPGNSGRSEDWHFDLQLDPDFIQRNYAVNSAALASAVIPGYPENEVCFNCCHPLTFTGAQPPDVGSFLMPGNGLLTVELNSWHADIRGTNAPPGWVPDPNKDAGDPNFPDDSGIPVPGANPPAALYPNNIWAFNVLTGTAFAPYPLPSNDPAHQGQLRAGDYVIVTGTLWQDIAHLKSSPIPLRQCFESVLSCQGGWLEIHPVDIVRYVSTPPALRKHVEVVAACGYPETMYFQSQIAPDDQPWDKNSSVLAYQEIVDTRFTDPNSLFSKSIVVDTCDASKLDINLQVQNPGRIGYYKSVVLTWWDVSSTPRLDACPAIGFPTFSAQGTNRSITVNVSDRNTGTPRGGATVAINGKSAITDSKGNAVLTYAECGSGGTEVGCLATVTEPGYATAYRTAPIGACYPGVYCGKDPNGQPVCVAQGKSCPTPPTCQPGLVFCYFNEQGRPVCARSINACPVRP
jgi:hypothetical protein